METTNTSTVVSIIKDKALFVGTILLLISALIFGVEILATTRNQEANFSIFMVHLLLSIAFIIVWIVVSARKRSVKHTQGKKYLLLTLFLFINCFSLNRSIVIFEDSCLWLQIALSLSWLSVFATLFFDAISRWVRLLIGVLLGFSLVLFLYFVLKLGIIHLIGLFGIIFIGIGIHVFVPAILVFMVTRFVVLQRKQTPGLLLSFCIGILLTVGVAVCFVMQWAALDKTVQRAYNRQLLEDKTGLPSWVEVSRNINRNWIAEKYMKAGIVYPFHEFWTSNDWWGFRQRNFDDIRQHDPLVVTASQFFDCNTISYDDKIRILASMYDKRHEAQERLWTGINLTTGNVLTNVRLYPEVRLAYTEKTITIVNNFHTSPEAAQWYRDEAIYTFQLPEGATVTALSLWINGKEQKAALTSKYKADSAYKTIVGVEQRDPSLVQWQEGNTVSVRVFPCTPSEHRVFKIGITSPLTYSASGLLYQNITFVGPRVRLSQETIKTEIVGAPIDVEFEGISPQQESPAVYFSEDTYNSDWLVHLSRPMLLDKPFTFENESYFIDSIRYTTEKIAIKNVYLDVNATWTAYEYEQIVQDMGAVKLFINHNGLWPVTPKSGFPVFEKAQANQFSFFPFFEISDPEHSLVITKGDYNSPQLADVSGSVYAEKMKKYFSKSKNIRVVVLDGQTPTYIKMLKELRAIKTTDCNIEQLALLLLNKQFTYPYEDDNRIALPTSKTSIVRKASVGKSSAPEHLLRLFTYNNVLRMIGTNYFTSHFITKQISDEAVKGYVVSPVTSLVVLESAEDYKRFDIQTQNEHSLGNASANAEGATPEPFEWMLIGVCAAVLFFVLMRKRKLKNR